MLRHHAMQLLLLSLLAVSFAQSALVKNAPSASDLDGVHILIDNDVDSLTNDTSVIFLSKKRNYQDSLRACEALGERGYPASSTAADNFSLSQLLKMTPVAEAEVKSSGRYWIRDHNAPKNRHDCSSIDRNGKVSKTWCQNQYPTICTNSAPRRRASTTHPEGDTSRQIKVPTNNLGTLQGHRDSTAFRFYGIPYAQPPVGKNRFAAPKPLRNRGKDTLVDANKFGYVCLQLPAANQTDDNVVLGAQESEDCLYLNVFTPTLKNKINKGIPVMVYVHGGSFTSLSGSSPVFEPGNLVSRGGVVVVTLNYRLSIFGLFQNQPAISKSAAPGNLATRDHIAALQWVQKNIATFGGDPNQVTIFGQSAGGWSMRALLSAPSAFGLYKNAIVESDPIGLPFSGPGFAAEIGKRTLRNLGCSDSDLACALSKTANQVRDAQVSAMEAVRKLPGNQWVQDGAVYRPCVDGDLIPANLDDLIKQGRHNTRANIMWGSTKDEQGSFITGNLPNPVPVDVNITQTILDLDGDKARYQKLMASPYYKFNNSDNDTVRNQISRAITDLDWTCPYQALSRGAAQHGVVYTYRFNHGRAFQDAIGTNTTAFCMDKICHGDDVVPTFGGGDIFPGTEQTGDNARFSRQIIDWTSTFARTGNPNPRKGSTGAARTNKDVTRSPWRAYSAGSNDVMELNLDSKMSRNVDKARCDWVEENVKFDYQLYGPEHQHY
ncbi:hypothetical protein BGZ59_010014 [Podila verticillata]|uniref:Carboxylesterase type B domain-containing protein n=1 Tax=Podila verticillata NRRL 6337 TaxID=1069443 RepID=A0A086TL58_9FUNG|nr:hypothetical protein BGZ59_010014 [Podila verticillata]KFH62685.1 hypothetical protein MVEG_12077 [Podila verticillata NRRL 6337]